LFDIVHETLQRVFTDSIVLLGAKLGSEAAAKGSLTDNFSDSSDYTVSLRSQAEIVFLPPNTVYRARSVQLSAFKYLDAKMAMITAAYVMAVARGFFHYRDVRGDVDAYGDTCTQETIEH
jgi:hypothetical protein